MPGPAPRPKGRLSRVVVPLGIVIVVITSLGFGIRWLIVSSSIENAKTGHCLAQVITSSDDPRVVGCDSAKAEFKVTGRVDQPEKCHPIPGTTSVYDTGKDYLCLADPDPQTGPQHAVNGVQAGDCLSTRSVPGHLLEAGDALVHRRVGGEEVA